MAKDTITTIKLSKETKERLDHLKQHEKESYNELIKKLINLLNICKKSPSLAARILRDIDRSKKRENLIENSEKILKKKTSVQNLQQQQNRQQIRQINPAQRQMPRPLSRREE